MKYMDIDGSDASNGSSTVRTMGHGLDLHPVPANAHGTGLPYAPIDWPNPGDVWGWKVGKRIASSGYFRDRHLYPPSGISTGGSKRQGFESKLSVQKYIQSAFPGADVNAFFASFSWKIPSMRLHGLKDHGEVNTPVTPGGRAEHPGSNIQSGTSCNAGNRMCSSLVEPPSIPSEEITCEICCSEPDFCRDCCCIFCFKTVSSAFGGHSYIRCEATVDGGICGHIAHTDCALKCYMAGTVGGSINLDVEYFCRCCNSRMDLIPHVMKLFQTCKSVDSKDNIENILNVGICILRGSKRICARKLLHRIETARAKLKRGDSLEDIWKEEDIYAVIHGGPCNWHCSAESAKCEEPLENRTGLLQMISPNLDYQIEPLVLEEEISQILQTLRKSQEFELQLAKEMLSRQKNCIMDLYKQIEQEKNELIRNASSTRSDALLDAALKTVERTKREYLKLKEMEEVAKGFGRTSNRVRKEHFGLEAEN